MAITINQTPNLYSPAYNDLIFIVTSPNKTQAGFKYIADVYCGGIVERVKNIPHPTYGAGVFNVGRIIESLVSSDISKTTYGFQRNLNSYTPFYIKFGEEYGSASSGTTIYPNQTTSSTYYAFNAELEFLKFQNYSYSDYVTQIGGGVVATRILSNKPQSVYIRDSEDAWLHAMSESSGTIFYASINTYNSAGALIQNVKVANPYQEITSANDRFVRFGCGTNNLNSIASSGIISGAQPIITGSVASYDVTFTKQTGTAVTLPHTFVIDNKCTKNVVYRFHFLNQIGGFDSFSFIRGSTKSVDIKRSSYKKVTGAMTSATTYGYAKSDRGSVTYNTSLQDNIKVKSDWVDESTQNWLQELITSPEVYYDDPTHGLVAVQVVMSKFDIKQTAQDKLFNLEIEYEPAYNRYRQRL